MSRLGNCISWLLLTLSHGAYIDDQIGSLKTPSLYKPIELDLNQMRSLAGLSDVKHLRQAVQTIANPRVVDSPGHSKVRDYIIDSLRKLQWQVELDIFTEKVPVLGYLTFKNIIARQNPEAQRFLMLACHYDSKYFKEFTFSAATDSAVPCAIMLNLAETLKDRFHKSDLSLMFVFFDGEEAFGDWSKEDSLYGSRHLATYWHENHLLDSIDLFLLLDLIGAPDTNFKLRINSTSSYYQRLVQLEDQLIKTGILKATRPIYRLEYQQDVEDDHKPFLEFDVPVIHLISADYPAVWHLPGDVEERIDYKIAEQANLVLRMFIVEYLRSESSSSVLPWAWGSV